MSIEERLVEMRNTLVAKELAEKEAKENECRLAYTRSLLMFASTIGGSEVLRELGIDGDEWRKYAEGFSGEVPRTVSMAGVAEVFGHEIRTVIRWGSDLTPSHSDWVYLELSWVDEKPLRHSVHIVTLSTLESQILGAVRRLLLKIKEELDARQEDRIAHEFAVEAAGDFIAAAKEYVTQLDEYELARDNWLKTEQERLWKPWTVYEIKVMPFVTAATPVEPETMVVLESPEQIAGELLADKPGCARVTEVLADGSLQERTIFGIYHGKRIEINELGWRYHRRYRVQDQEDYEHRDGPYVHVPATVQEAPVDPPHWVGDWRDVCDAIHRDKVKGTPLGKGYESAYHRAFRLSPRVVASLEDPEQLFSK